MGTIAPNAAGHRRAPVTMPGYHTGKQPRNKGLRFPPDPPTVEEIIAVMRATGENSDGARLRALIVLLWRAGLRISEALDLAETELDRPNGKITIRRGRAASAARSDWTAGPGPGSSHGSRSGPASRRRAAVRDPRTDGREALGGVRRPQTAQANRYQRRRATPLCAPPVEACARYRDGARRRSAGRHPAPARA